MRVLGATRLSHDTDESTSIARQREQIELTTRARGDVLVNITEDTDVSGAVAPFDRPGLGPWLTGPLAASWDVLMVSKLDRLTRSLRDFDDFRIWCDKHGKSVVSVSESIDLSTSHGRMFANLLAMFAQFERERMSERRADAARKARREGYYDGRSVYFGYTVNEHARYVKDDVYALLAAEIAQDRISGRSYSWIARKLNEGTIPPSGGSEHWQADKVQKILLNPSLNGIITKAETKKGPDGQDRRTGGWVILRGDGGMPLKFTDDPILGDGKWGQLQAAVKVTPRGQRVEGFPLTRIAFCDCGQPLYGNRRPGGRQPYYRCASGALDHIPWCGARTIPAAMLEDRITKSFLKRWGYRELYRKTTQEAKDYRGELEAVVRRIEEIEREYTAGIWPAASAARMLAAQEAERERLESLPVVPAREDWQPSGITVAAHWEALDGTDDKGLLLRKMGVRAVAQRDAAGEIHAVISLGDPEGFEQASGLLLPHMEQDHEPWYEVAGAYFTRDSDGVLTEVVSRELGEAETFGMVKDYLRLQVPEA